eukprot:m.190762 g.190762  ORF g.190762 m.190762 type:complete len:468 (+) comp18239_c0_seq2:135-1538(+)
MWGSVLGCCSRRSNHFFVPRAVRRAVASAPQTSPANARCKHTKQQPARGMRDLLPDDAQRLRHVVDTVHRVARAFGFRETITPVVEHATLFQRTLGLDSDVVSKEMYTLGPDNDLCLRPENTAGVIRALLNVGQLGKPHRLVYSGPMFRYERPQKGRYREFWQVGAEHVGADTVQSDTEMISMAWLFLQRLGVHHEVTLRLNTLCDQEARKAHQIALHQYLRGCADGLSRESQRRLAAGQHLLRVFDSKHPNDAEIARHAPRIADFAAAAHQRRFEEVLAGLDALQIPFVVDPTLVRGLDYYTHTVWEFDTDKLGAKATVLAGGRYDGLANVLSNGRASAPAVGWAAGVERLDLLRQACGHTSAADQRILAIVEPSSGVVPRDCVGERTAFRLRQHDVCVYHLCHGSLAKQMKTAQRIGASVVWLLGEQELADNKVSIRDMETGTQRLELLEEAIAQEVQLAGIPDA